MVDKILPRVSICICTYRRTKFLLFLLKELEKQNTEELLEFSITVVDNDRERSSEAIVNQFQKTTQVDVTYCVEPVQNIALARNKALSCARGDYVAFIDDDEFPSSEWLARLFRACKMCNADGVLGPVLPHFDGVPPPWVKKGGFCDRPSHPSGFQIHWTQGRTGNLLFRRDILNGVDPVFRAEFGSGGEDRDFFRRMISAGKSFVWCADAPVYEWVPPARWKRGFMVRRALLRGKMSLRHGLSFAGVVKSLVAVIGYAIALPISWMLGQHLFMKVLIKGCDHAGKLSALMGIDLVKQTYVLE